jgi:hypothetical protein
MDFNRPLTESPPILESPASPSGEPELNVPATPPCSGCGSTEPPNAQGQRPVKTCRAARVGNKFAAIHEGRAKLAGGGSDHHVRRADARG